MEVLCICDLSLELFLKTGLVLFWETIKLMSKNNNQKNYVEVVRIIWGIPCHISQCPCCQGIFGQRSSNLLEAFWGSLSAFCLLAQCPIFCACNLSFRLKGKLMEPLISSPELSSPWLLCMLEKWQSPGNNQKWVEVSYTHQERNQQKLSLFSWIFWALLVEHFLCRALVF